MKPQGIFPRAAAILMMVVAGSSFAADPGAEQARDLLNNSVAYLEQA
jgi:hypothetical protein